MTRNGQGGRTALPRPAVALFYGALCHACFALGIGTMMVAMFFGMSRSLGALAAPWSWIANALLLAQFPIVHSFLLSKRGRALLAHLAPVGTGTTLSRRRLSSPSPPCKSSRCSHCGLPAGRSGGRHME